MVVNVSNFKEFVEKINRDINEKYNNFLVKFKEEQQKFRERDVKDKSTLFSIKDNAKDPEEKKRMYYVNGGS